MQPQICYNSSMSTLITIGIIVLSVLIMSFLTLVPGTFALFSHYAQGRFSKKHASDLSFFFLLGAEITASCVFLSTFIIVAVFIADTPSTDTSLLTWLFIIIMIILSLTSLLFYFRPGRGTELFISRKIARAIDHQARNVKNRSDAFVLGALCGTPELIFTVPLFIITSCEILQLSSTHPMSSMLSIVYIVAPIVPLIIYRWQFLHGHNLADIQRARVHDKLFTRLILSISYLIIAVILIQFRI